MDEHPRGVKAYDELPVVYATYLRMRDSGASDLDIAAALDVPLEALPTLGSLANEKLARLRRRRSLPPRKTAVGRDRSNSLPGTPRLSENAGENG